MTEKMFGNTFQSIENVSPHLRRAESGVYSSAGSIVEGDERRHTSQARRNQPDAVPTRISSFALAQNSGALKLPNHQYYLFAGGVIVSLLIIVWQSRADREATGYCALH